MNACRMRRMAYSAAASGIRVYWRTSVTMRNRVRFFVARKRGRAKQKQGRNGKTRYDRKMARAGRRYGAAAARHPKTGRKIGDLECRGTDGSAGSGREIRFSLFRKNRFTENISPLYKT